MRLSAKGRYALASAICMAEHYSFGECMTVIRISGMLGISKIYLEQVFSLLKRGGIVTSLKGAQGGYQLARMPRQITVLDILSSVELSLFEPAEETVGTRAPEIDSVMRLSAFDALDQAVKHTLERMTLEELVGEVEKRKSKGGFMFYI